MHHPLRSLAARLLFPALPATPAACGDSTARCQTSAAMAAQQPHGRGKLPVKVTLGE